MIDLKLALGYESLDCVNKEKGIIVTLKIIHLSRIRNIRDHPRIRNNIIFTQLRIQIFTHFILYNILYDMTIEPLSLSFTSKFYILMQVIREGYIRKLPLIIIHSPVILQ